MGWQDGTPVQAGSAAKSGGWQQGAPVNGAPAAPSPLVKALTPAPGPQMTTAPDGQKQLDIIGPARVGLDNLKAKQREMGLNPDNPLLGDWLLNAIMGGANATIKGGRDLATGLATAIPDLTGHGDVGDEIRHAIPQIKSDSLAQNIGAGVIQYGTPAAVGANLAKGLPLIKDASPVIKWITGLLGAAGGDVAATDPGQASTIGTMLGLGPTKINPGDSPMAKRVKVGAEAVPVGAALDGVVSGVTKSVKAATPLLLNFTEQGRKFQAGKQLAEAGVPENVGTQAKDLEAGAYKPVTSDVVNTPQAQGMARSVINAPEGEGLVNRVKENERAVSTNFDQALSPDTKVPQGAARTEFAGQAQARLNVPTQRVESIERAQGNVAAQNAQAQGAVTANAGTRQDASATLADLIDQERQNATDVKNGLYGQAKQLGASVQLDPAALADTATTVRSDIGPLAAQDQSLNSILGDLERLAPEGEPVPTGVLGPDGQPITRPPDAQSVTLADLIDLRPRLSKAIDGATGKYRGDVVQHLQDLRAAIDQQINGLSEGDAPAAQALRTAEANFRDNFAPKFREGQGGALDKADRAGTPVPPTAVAESFVKTNAAKGAREAVGDLNRIFADSPNQGAARASARSYIVGLMADQLGPNVTAPRVAQFIAKYGEAIDGVPGLRQEVQQMQNRLAAGSTQTAQLDQALKDAQASRSGVEKDIAQSPMGLWVDGDPKQVVTEALNDPMKMKKLITAAKRDPSGAALGDVKNQIKAQINDQIRNDGSQTAGGVNVAGSNQAKALENKDVVVSLAKANDMLKAGTPQRKALETVFSPAEMKNLDLYRKQLELSTRITSMKGIKTGSDTALNTLSAAQAGVGISQGAVKSGMVFRFLKFLDAHSLNTSGKRLKLMTDALTDPDLAGALVMEYNQSTAKVIEKRFSTYLANNVLAGGTNDQQPEKKAKPAGN